jgi:protein-S-isoprenylcysteine O-methyltransferase Ste14
MSAGSVTGNLEAFQKLRIKVLWALVSLIGCVVLFTQSVWEGTLIYGFDVYEMIEIIGLALIGVAILGRVWSTLYIGGRKSSEIVSSGPYSITRNPLYLFSILGAAGIGAQAGSIVTTLLTASAAIVVFYITIKREEEFLSATFGAVYDTYLKSVPRLWPNFSLYKEGNNLVVQPTRLYSTLRDASLFFVAFPIFEVIEWFQEAGLLPVLVRLW